MDKSLKVHIFGEDGIAIIIFIAIICAISIPMIATTVLIAKDGIAYIELAKEMGGDISKAVQKTELPPGYPYLIFLMHKVMGLFYGAQSLRGWIISAQIVSLLSKIIACSAIYFIGSYFVGKRASFWGVLILNVLPDSIEYGIDVLSDWPSIMILVISFLLLILAVQKEKKWIFGLSGLAAGAGYLVRSECGQIVLYGCVWLIYCLIRPKDKMRGAKTVSCLVLLLGGFAVVATGYMLSKGYVFPKQHFLKLPSILSMVNTDNNLTSLFFGRIIGNEKMITNMCHTLLYYYVPALMVGCYYYFKRQVKTAEHAFFAASFILVNTTIYLLQSAYGGFLSRRHTLVLVAFTIFYIPLGFEIIGKWLGEKNTENKSAIEKNTHRWYSALIAIGFIICAVKMVNAVPLRWKQQGYRDTAEWLKNNTPMTSVIAVPDPRIAFYAERKGIVYETGGKLPVEAGYVVTGDKEENLKVGKETKEEYSTIMNKKKNSGKVEIYKIIR